MQVLAENLLILCVIVVLLLCSLFISFLHKSAAFITVNLFTTSPPFLTYMQINKNPQLSEIAAIEIYRLWDPCSSWQC